MATPKLKPLGDDLLIHPIEDSAMTESGRLYIPDQAKQRVDQGIVVAKGPLVTEEIEIADHVIFSGYSGDKVSVGGSGIFFVIPQQFIVAIITDSSVVLFDSLTIRRILDERQGEAYQKWSGDSKATDIVRGIFRDVKDRLDTFTRSEGFEF